ncbi:DUF917 domain-containing protein [Leucobacter aridicollis]|uniref:DUF917 domain-containing protein n=1 Tax=Leucobacter aridicollis TaxID=283878 RepID=UPI0021041C5C|nr:DUF917 domain-containing protein [Leucobacter aridicollis]UTX51812.1 DUF917 domain-containing protein [Leucobacter aridicollis]
MSWKISVDDIDDLARGSAVLGTGGGGDPYIGGLLAKEALRRHGDVTVVTLDELPDDAVVACVSMLGAPTVMVEKLPSLDEVMRPVTELSEHYGRPITHIMCIEVGGVNSTIPIAAAAATGLPVLDADGMGRAFPELQMVLPTLYGVTSSPLAYSDEKGNVGVLRTVDNAWGERIIRVAAVEMGCSIMLSGFHMSGATAKKALVADSLSLCVNVGKGIVDARAEKVDAVERATDILGGRVLYGGKVTDVERATTAGFARGRATIEEDGRTLTLLFQNEHLIAELDGEVLATTPDLIMVLDHETGEPVTTEGLRYGQRVRVIAAPADERWHSPAAIEMVGPRYFGYDLEPHRFDGSVRPGSPIADAAPDASQSAGATA